MKTVLLCAKAYPPVAGGLESYGEQVARAYLRAGIRPTVLSSAPGQVGLQELDYPEGKVAFWNVGQGAQPLLLARLLTAGRRLIRDQNFDFLHATTWRPAAALLPWKNDKPLILSAHGRELLITPRFMRPLRRYVLKNTQALFAVSTYTLDRIKLQFPDLSHKCWFASFNGLSYEQESRRFERKARLSDTVNILTFCRLVERKNISGVLHALRKILDLGTVNFHYKIAGKGPLFQSLSRLTTELGLADKVTFTGYLPNDSVIPAFLSSDIFAHPQLALNDGKDVEGFGLVIADAMSFGVAVLVGKAGGPADFVEDNQTGIIVDGSNVDAIASALAKLIADRAERERLGLAGREWVRSHLSWDRHVADILNSVN